MAKKVIKLTEAQLKSVVERVISEQTAAGQEPVVGNDGRKQYRQYSISESDVRRLKESLTYFQKGVPAYRSQLLNGGIVVLRGLGLKTVNNPGFFKNTGDSGTLTHTFTFGVYYFNLDKEKNSIATYYEYVYYIGSGGPNASADEIAGALQTSSPIANHLATNSNTVKRENLKVSDAYVSLRNVVGAQKAATMIAQQNGFDVNVVMTRIVNALSDSANPESMYVGDDASKTPDEYGQLPSTKYQPYVDELKKSLGI